MPDICRTGGAEVATKGPGPAPGCYLVCGPGPRPGPAASGRISFDSRWSIVTVIDRRRRLGRRQLGLAAVGVVTVGVAAGLLVGRDGAGGPDLVLQVRDQNLRVLGAQCAGGSGLMYVHADAEFRITDAAGQVLATGRLPVGEAIAATTIDFGQAVRVPSFCQFRLQLSEPLSADPSRLVVEGGAPIPIRSETSGRFTAAVPEIPGTEVHANG